MFSEEDMKYYNSEYENFQTDISNLDDLVTYIEEQYTEIENLSKKELKFGNRNAAKMYLFVKKTHKDNITDIEKIEGGLEGVDFLEQIIHWQKIHERVKGIQDDLLLDKMTETEDDDLLEEIKSALNEGDEEKAQNLLSFRKKLKNDNVIQN
jgi:hypothetical protein